MTGGSNKRVSLAALICAKPGHRPRLIYPEFVNLNDAPVLGYY